MSEVLFKNVIASMIEEYHPKDLMQFIKKHPHDLKERRAIYEKTSHLLDLNLTVLSTDRNVWMKAVTFQLNTLFSQVTQFTQLPAIFMD